MVLIFLIDALRHDFVTKSNTPFLHNIAKKGALVSLKPTLAYEARPAFFSGLYPKNSNIAFRYIYNPEKSPFRIAPFISQIPLKLKYKNKLLRKTVNLLSDGQLYKHLGIRNIPWKFSKYFMLGESDYHWEPGYLENKVTLFDLLRESNLNWVANSWPSPQYGLSYNGTLNAYSEAIQKYGSSLNLFYSTIADTDWTEHKYGPDSHEMTMYLQVADKAIEVIYNDIKNRFGKIPRLFVFGDHGAVSVKYTFNLESHIKKLPLKVGSDFVYFLDSALVRFWTNNSKAQYQIEKMLNEQANSHGRILNNSDFSHYHFALSRAIKGDIFYLANPGVLIFPNFHNKDVPEKGMHGYDPEHLDEYAAGVIYSDKELMLNNKKPFETIDIFPTIAALLGINKNLEIDGQSIII